MSLRAQRHIRGIMARPRTSLHTFLKTAKAILHDFPKGRNQQHFTFVIGNSAADLDSICSSILLAYFRTYSPLPSAASKFCIPLSNIPRADLALRPELVPVLAYAGLKVSDVLTLSDIPAASGGKEDGGLGLGLEPEDTSWVLVDHNAMEGELGKRYKHRVVGCIDHHDEEGQVPKSTPGMPRIVEKCGSCSSLVVGYAAPGWSELSKVGSEDGARAKDRTEETKVWDAEVARLTLAPILIDTSNLKNPSKTTDKDIWAVEHLNKIIAKKEGGEIDTEIYFHEISEKEKDVDGLSLVDLLRKDYKEWNENGVSIGICSVVKDMGYVVEGAASESKLLDTIRKFARERKLDVVSVMTRMLVKGTFKRELLVWGLSEKGVECAKKFEDDAGKLELEAWKDGALDVDERGAEKIREGWCRCWTQGNAQDGRKQIAPLMRASVTS